jgi:hypothetical protein
MRILRQLYRMVVPYWFEKNIHRTSVLNIGNVDQNPSRKVLKEDRAKFVELCIELDKCNCLTSLNYSWHPTVSIYYMYSVNHGKS